MWSMHLVVYFGARLWESAYIFIADAKMFC